MVIAWCLVLFSNFKGVYQNEIYVENELFQVLLKNGNKLLEVGILLQL